jgi:hypothetical protein
MRRSIAVQVATAALEGPYSVKYVPPMKSWDSKDLPGYVHVKSLETGGLPVQVIKDLLFYAHWILNGRGADLLKDRPKQVAAIRKMKVKELRSLSGMLFKKDSRLLDMKLNGFRIYTGIKDPDAQVKAVSDAVMATIAQLNQKEQERLDQVKRQQEYEQSPKGRAEADRVRKLQTAQRSEDQKALYDKWGKDTVKRVSAKQIGGDDGYQWNVLIDGRSFVNGLTRAEVPYYKIQAYKKINGIKE